MGKAVALMTAGLGTYMTLKMWSEFNEAPERCLVLPGA